MNAKKLKKGMTPMEIALTMSELNLDALMFTMYMIGDPKKFPEDCRSILICDAFDIRGSKLFKLFANCCNQDSKMFIRTVKMFESGVFNEEEIHTNLDLDNPISFINDDLVIDGVPSYIEPFGPNDEKWDEYCNKQKISFIERTKKENKKLTI